MRLSTSNGLLVTHFNPNSSISELYRTLKTNVGFSSSTGELSSVMVASTVRGEGRTTTAANLAVVYSQYGKRVLLIDADLRNPSIHTIFQVKNHIGITDVVMNDKSLSNAIVESGIENLSLLTVGSLVTNPAELLSSANMSELVSKVKNDYDIVIFDSPPILDVTDGLVISGYTDGVILVVKAGQVDKKLIIKAKEKLCQASAKILGSVINNASKKFLRNAVR